MGTLNQTTLEVEDLLYGMAQIERPVEDSLATNVTDDTDTEWRWNTESLHRRGTLVEYAPVSGAVGEIVYETEDHPAGADQTVRRAYRGTTATVAGFTADTDPFRVNPIYPRIVIQRLINQVIDNELHPEIWLRTERSLTWTSGDTGYDLNAADYRVEQMYQYNLNSDNAYHPFHPGMWDVVNSVDSGASASGRLLRVYRVYDSTATVYYTARTKPQSSAYSALGDTILQMIPYAVVGKLLLMRTPVARSDRRRRRQDEQVHHDQGARDYQAFMGEFLRMKDAEKRRLKMELLPQHKWQPVFSRRG